MASIREAFTGASERPSGRPSDRVTQLAPVPKCVSDTGLTESFLGDLLAKHLYDGGVLNLAQLSSRMALPGKVITDVLHFLRAEARVEVLGNNNVEGQLRYHLTNRGRQSAIDALARSGYIGPAPVPLRRYAQIVEQQTIHQGQVTRDRMKLAFSDVVVRERVLDQLGAAMNSGRAVFIYGHAGTGKTYITQRLSRLFDDVVLVPHAVSVDETTIAVFDPLLHKRIVREGQGNDESLQFSDQYDQRWVTCSRPVVISGGELTNHMLEVQLEHLTKEYRAPLQLKANNGVFIIDDMGRQRITPEEVFNRWIVPLEERIDYLSLGSGKHFSVPFDLILVFSTNLDPTDLADEAFLRRIGFKIRFDPLNKDEYRAIWLEQCTQSGIVCPPAVFDFVVEQLHRPNDTPLLPCHPRDLLGMASDYLDYNSLPRLLNTESVQWAWDNYFVSLRSPAQNTSTPTRITRND